MLIQLTTAVLLHIHDFLCDLVQLHFKKFFYVLIGVFMMQLASQRYYRFLILVVNNVFSLKVMSYKASGIHIIHKGEEA